MADLTGADLTDALLQDVTDRAADILDSRWLATKLTGTTMPDGSVHS
jgi:uncharacterized protein YjbI with pentapeptide repeats